MFDAAFEHSKANSATARTCGPRTVDVQHNNYIQRVVSWPSAETHALHTCICLPSVTCVSAALVITNPAI